MISYSWERPPFPAKNVLKLLYQDGANGAQSIMVSLISLHKKCVTKYYKLKLYKVYNKIAVTKFYSKRCDKQVLIKYFVDIKMELKEIVVPVKNWYCYKNNKSFA